MEYKMIVTHIEGDKLMSELDLSGPTDITNQRKEAQSHLEAHQ
jgi:hypothetical protein